MEENMNTYNCLINNINYTIILFIFLDGYWTDIGRILDGYWTDIGRILDGYWTDIQKLICLQFV
jgi:hypothetical protein